MFTRASSVSALALAVSLVSAQTSTVCNPLEKTCPADPALGDQAICDFTAGGACSVFTDADGTKLSYDNSNGALFSIKAATDAPTITSADYIFFGSIEVEIQAAPGDGIVTSAVLESDDLDEIDWEWVGGDNAHAQTNYFSKGDHSTYNRGETHAVDNPTGSFHTYGVEWTADQIVWTIDGTAVRTLTAASVGANFPQTPMQVKLGTWCAGGPNSAEGTREWAGGYTDFSKAPFNAYYKSITITDYAGGSSAAKGGIKQYVYGDHSGNWQSIQVIKGGSSSSSSSSSLASSTSTSPSSSSTKGSQSQSTQVQTSVSTAPSSSSSSQSTLATTTTGNQSTSTQSTVPSNAAVRDTAACAGTFLAGAAMFAAQMLL